MEFIQKKTADRAVNHFLPKAMEQEISLVWDRFEGQLPECGFCESGLSCQDCLQGPCISHPFRDQAKQGVCGKDRDILAAQSLLRLTIKGTMSFLDQLSDFVDGVRAGIVEPHDRKRAEQTLGAIRDLLERGDFGGNTFPPTLTDQWKKLGIFPEGIARDIFKASQQMEGGTTCIEETLLWSFKSALLGYIVHRLQGELKAAVFGSTGPCDLEVNLGVLNEGTPSILLYGPVPPMLKYKIAETADQNNVRVMGVCTDPLLPPYRFNPVTTYVSQEIPVMTGAVDLIVAAAQLVNPSLAQLAASWKVPVVQADGLKKQADVTAFARDIVEKAEKAFELRQQIVRDIPSVKATASMGFIASDLNISRIVSALEDNKIKGIAMLSGSNNVKYTQDEQLVAIAKVFLENDILCVSDGEASVALAKYGLLDPNQREDICGEGLKALLSSLGEKMPSVIDCAMTDFLPAVATAVNRSLSNYPICAYFPEASRTAEVVMALAAVAIGVPTYFWPCLPVTGSANTLKALDDLCRQKFGAPIHVVTEKIDARAKAELFLNTMNPPPPMSGKSWE